MTMRNLSDIRQRTIAVLTKKRLSLIATILAVIFIFAAVNDPAIVGVSATKRELRFIASDATTKPSVSLLTRPGARGHTDAH